MKRILVCGFIVAISIVLGGQTLTPTGGSPTSLLGTANTWTAMQSFGSNAVINNSNGTFSGVTFSVCQTGQVPGNCNATITSPNDADMVMTFSGAFKANTLGNVATTSAVCFNTSTFVLSYDGTIGTCTTSSIRFKHDIRPLVASEPNPIQAVMAMQPISFVYNAEMNTPGEQVGLPAENLASIDPRLVGFDKDGKPQSLRVFAVIGYLTAAIQEQQTEINQLKMAMRHKGRVKR